MLSDISIRNFAVIDDIKISFQDGFSVLTGETGAGKSIIIEAVNLLLGSRASADLVRSGCELAELEAFFDIDMDSQTARMLSDQGSDPSEGLMIRRQIYSSGKSQVFINSKRSTLDLLKQVTQNLAGISSQHAHQGLLKEENHLEILDEFAGTVQLKNEVKDLYLSIVPLKKKIHQLSKTLEENQKDQDLLQFQIDEIGDAKLLENEDELLEKELKILSNAAQIFETVNGTVHEVHDSEGSILERMSSLIYKLEKFSPADERLEKIVQRLSSAMFELQDTADDLRDFSSGIDLDPASLEIKSQRLDLIAKLKRKYGPTLADVFSGYENMVKKISDTDEIKDQIKGFENDIKVLSEQIREKAGILSGLRKKAGRVLSEQAGEQLAGLEMSNAKFEVSFSVQEAKNSEDILTADQCKIGPDGQDRVSFLLSPNPGEVLKPLAKIASGGELSRIVLALKAVLSKNQSLETLIFDEVDAGIGGATSEKVGLKLKELSQKHQVICITHLAQIAKYGGHQFRISKTVHDGRTFTSIVPLTDAQQRVEEIARMIGGKQITDATLEHARELLSQAAS
ncbi:MAG: DNA repair protein RecN [Proteobacteria bacterium]|nr:DNA repair protein RecN [Pseudomonadota bacterium]MBU1388376.1 DNA repair protein RecN [Pseudomonadota bacterium]MBU1542800.1 DNA repair protein RecN [Pseudomonadota bacterium]